MAALLAIDTSTLALFFLASVSVGGVAYVFLYPLLSGAARAEKRKQELVTSQPTERVAVRNQVSRRDSVAQSLKEIEAKAKANSKLSVEAKLSQAGLRISKQRFYMLSLMSAFIFGFVSFVLSGGNVLVALSVSFAGGLGIPQWLLNFLRNRRIKKFVDEFPNAMDVIVRGVKAGLPIGDCLRIIANEAREPVKTEFRLIIEAQALGISVPDAAARLYDRIPIAEANFFGIVLAIQAKAGGNLAEALANLSRVLRERKKMKGKIQAMSSEAKSSAAIIAALPVVVSAMLSVSSPNYLQLLITTNVGNIALACSAIWMTIGVLVMRKMINFDI